ncbi:hypothetical protein GCM10020358_68050 [Amorphoplanes nipponensis]|uniref:Uncharacterized protein n=1 Tax=Actinoplanes nipponensis TaxID=135950 RepID=A0A919JLX0_9ACTN|nr:hypothetical protein [Actinoplanes nipponensis]GIE51571.1 hypothetical protein Ani05nite_51050 [Actinoplanes nipponensis]
MINPGANYPGALPISDAREDFAAAALKVFLAAVRERADELEQLPIRHRVARIDGEPVRTPDDDRDGWFAWSLPISDGTTVRIRIPGVDLPRMRDDLSSTAPCLYVNANPWGWDAAVGSVANEGMKLR